MTGFAAATYLRGISFIQLPTTLLSQVDSSIGGKTGVDFNQYKNMIGAFHQPSLVYMDLNTLKTLNDRELCAGMAEVIKHGLIKDSSYYSWIKDHHIRIMNRDYEVLEEMIYKSCQIKGDVVEHDPKEKGERALLNFGHTVGHSIEKLMNFEWLHGECVAIGSIVATAISMNKGFISKDEFDDIRKDNQLNDVGDFTEGQDALRTCLEPSLRINTENIYNKHFNRIPVRMFILQAGTLYSGCGTGECHSE